MINLHKCFPEAPIYTTFYNQEKMDDIFKEMNIITSSLQKKKIKEYNRTNKKENVSLLDKEEMYEF